MFEKVAVAISVGFLALILLFPSAQAQMGGQAASPPAKADCKFPDGKSIHIDYSSPRMRNRKIFGGLVPYGEVWRVGANRMISPVCR